MTLDTFGIYLRIGTEELNRAISKLETLTGRPSEHLNDETILITVLFDKINSLEAQVERLETSLAHLETRMDYDPNEEL